MQLAMTAVPSAILLPRPARKWHLVLEQKQKFIDGEARLFEDAGQCSSRQFPMRGYHHGPGIFAEDDVTSGLPLPFKSGPFKSALTFAARKARQAGHQAAATSRGTSVAGTNSPFSRASSR